MLPDPLGKSCRHPELALGIMPLSTFRVKSPYELLNTSMRYRIVSIATGSNLCAQCFDSKMGLMLKCTDVKHVQCGTDSSGFLLRCLEQRILWSILLLARWHQCVCVCVFPICAFSVNTCPWRLQHSPKYVHLKRVYAILFCLFVSACSLCERSLILIQFKPVHGAVRQSLPSRFGCLVVCVLASQAFQHEKNTH